MQIKNYPVTRTPHTTLLGLQKGVWGDHIGCNIPCTNESHEDRISTGDIVSGFSYEKIKCINNPLTPTPEGVGARGEVL